MKNKFVKGYFLATLYGGLIGFGIMILLIIVGEWIGLGDSQFFVGLLIGAGIGFMQGRFLNKFFNSGLMWMWATVAGMGGAFILAEFMPAITGLFEWNINYALIGTGLLSGIFQYFVIKNHSKNGLLWILFSLATYSLIMLELWISNMKDLFPGFVVISFFLIILGPFVTIGLIGGIGLKMVLSLPED